jgi:RIO-like serine/threonine protein kinase
MDRQITTQIDSKQKVLKVLPRKMDEAQMLRDMDFRLAQKILLDMHENGLITDDEFNKITDLNRKSFSPYLSELHE